MGVSENEQTKDCAITLILSFNFSDYILPRDCDFILNSFTFNVFDRSIILDTRGSFRFISARAINAPEAPVADKAQQWYLLLVLC